MRKPKKVSRKEFRLTKKACQALRSLASMHECTETAIVEALLTLEWQATEYRQLSLMGRMAATRSTVGEKATPPSPQQPPPEAALLPAQPGGKP